MTSETRIQAQYAGVGSFVALVAGGSESQFLCSGAFQRRGELSGSSGAEVRVGWNAGDCPRSF